ncbi:unnamed protein product [Gordionus sp. m RMFG-2023]
MDKRCLEDPEIENYSEAIPSFISLRSHIDRLLMKYRPPMPHSILDIELSAEYAMTTCNERFLIHGTGNLYVFGTDSMLRLTEGSNMIYMDGTFHDACNPLFFPANYKHIQIQPLILSNDSLLILISNYSIYKFGSNNLIKFKHQIYLQLGCTYPRPHKHHICYIDDNLLNSIFEFVKFPIKNEILLSKWIKAMNKENFTPNKFSKLCGAHFKPECFMPSHSEKNDHTYATNIYSLAKKKKLEIPINTLEVEGLEEPVRDNSPKTSTSYPNYLEGRCLDESVQAKKKKLEIPINI